MDIGRWLIKDTLCEKNKIKESFNDIINASFLIWLIFEADVDLIWLKYFYLFENNNNSLDIILWVGDGISHFFCWLRNLFISLFFNSLWVTLWYLLWNLVILEQVNIMSWLLFFCWRVMIWEISLPSWISSFLFFYATIKGFHTYNCLLNVCSFSLIVFISVIKFLLILFLNQNVLFLLWIC